MAKPIGQIVINLSAGTSQLILDLEKAQGKLRDFSAQGQAAGRGVASGMKDHAVPAFAAASGALRELEGNFTNNIRAVERLISSIPFLAKGLQKIFPLVGGAALVGIVAKIGSEAYEAFKKYADGTARANLALRELVSTGRAHNDQLAITNDRLGLEISRLTGAPTNSLKLLLDEAAASARKLTESLSESLKELYKLLAQEEIGFFYGKFTGQAPTSDLKDIVGGPTGVTRTIGKVSDIQAAADPLITSAKTPAEANAVRADVRDKANALLVDLKNRILAKLAQTEEAADLIAKTDQIQDPEERIRQRGRISKNLGLDAGVDPANRATQLRGMLDVVRGQQRNVNLQYENGTSEQIKTGLQAGAANEKLGAPLEEELDKLRAKIRGLDVELKAIGGTEEQKTLARAFLATEEAVERLNKAFKAQNQPALSSADRQKEYAKQVQVAQAEATLAFGKRADEAIQKTLEHVKAQELLTAAIGGTFEAQKRAEVESRLFTFLGPEKYNSKDAKDPNTKVGGEAARFRTATAAEISGRDIESSKNQIDSLKRQADQASALAEAEAKGAGAVRMQIELEKEAEIVRTRGALGYVEASRARDLFNKTEQKDSETRTKNLIFETESIQKLANSYKDGADAARKAELEVEIARIKRNTPVGTDSGPEVQAAINKSNASYQGQIAESAGKLVNQYANQSKALVEQLEEIRKIAETEDNRLGKAVAIKANIDEQNKLVRDQTLAVGTAADGMKQFFRDIASESESAAAKVDAAMHKALDGINDQLAKILTGQKSSWKKFFQGLAESQIKTQLHDLEKLAIGGLGGSLGTVIKGGSSDPWHKGIPGTGGGRGGVGGALGKVFGLGRRDGQTPETSWYVSVVPGAQGAGSRGPGGSPLSQQSGLYYHIDAINVGSGVSPEQIYSDFGRALSAVHSQSIGGAVMASQENAMRQPGGMPSGGGFGGG